jgi:DNA-binding SARP family transcriptional activator
MEFRILGPLEVRDGDREVRLRGGKERALLALLLINANRTLAMDRIVDALWGDGVPETAHKMVQIYVSHLRKVLPQDTLRTRPPGYALAVEQGKLDLDRFETAVSDARAALEADRAEAAAESFREALSLWRGACAPAANPATVRSCPAAAVETPRSLAAWVSTGAIAITAACAAKSPAKSVRLTPTYPLTGPFLPIVIVHLRSRERPQETGSRLRQR